MSWDGKERRHDYTEMRELLVRIDEKLGNLADNYSQHVIDDERRFIRIEKKQDDHSRLIWIGVGGLGVLQLIFHFLK